MKEKLENQKKENFVIVRLKKDGKVIHAIESSIETANDMKDSISEIYENETGGITIFIDIRLTEQKK